MTSFLTDVWKDLIAGWIRETQILSGTSRPKTTSETVRFPVITATGIGPNGNTTSSSGITGYPALDSEYSQVIGRIAVDNPKNIVLDQGGRWDFKVQKNISDGVERFTVSMGDNGYGRGLQITEGTTWAEASAAMNKFRDEFESAFEALVQISTLQANGVHEDS